MLRRDPKYSRIAAGFNFAGQSSCWLAADHLLVVEQQFVTEEYRRFNLADVQSLLLRRTLPGRLGAWLLSISTVLFSSWAGLVAFFHLRSGAALSTADWGYVAFLGIIAALLGTSLIIHLALGPTAALELHTAVQTYRLPGVSRWRKGLKIFAALNAATAAAQRRANEPAPETPAA